ncbi:Homeobox-leucine zipper protein ROC3 [Acorus calamus]|uniref:Homeobox-leucine zipper protein ROC3 n=1 Tax=Acorus calamus TaxID=4465 RepID=A0AAV9F4X8_ACOCL|nr:Homeobox-leucine zipper protein ROC3 [Acorus calamus]
MDNHNEMGFSFNNHQPEEVIEAGGDNEDLFDIGDLDLGFLMGDSDYNGPLKNNSYNININNNNMINNSNINSIPTSKNKKKKEKINRHSKEQIQILQSLFKQCPHPDERRMKELSQLLNLKKSQIKYWFQNQRSYEKIKTERQDNGQLKDENDRLRIDNSILQKKIANMVCSKCRGDDNQMSLLLSSLECSMRQLREQNSQMEEEIQHLQTNIDKTSTQSLLGGGGGGGGFTRLAHLQTQSSAGLFNSTTNVAAAAPIGTNFMHVGSSSSSVPQHAFPRQTMMDNARAHGGMRFVGSTYASRNTDQVPSMQDIVSGRISVADPWLGGRITHGGHRLKKKSVRDDNENDNDDDDNDDE